VVQRAKELRTKAVVQNSKAAQRENAALMAENVSLSHAIHKSLDSRATVPAEFLPRIAAY
jgi:hypothetical protein